MNTDKTAITLTQQLRVSFRPPVAIPPPKLHHDHALVEQDCICPRPRHTFGWGARLCSKEAVAQESSVQAS